jgi:hypothetical protein
MSAKLYRLYCEYCNWKMTTDGTDAAAKALVEIKVSAVPGGSPKIDPETKKLTTPKAKQPKKRFKCPQCGRGVTPKLVKEEPIPEPEKPSEDHIVT